MNQHLHVNKTNFHIKVIALGLAQTEAKGDSEMGGSSVKGTHSTNICKHSLSSDIRVTKIQIRLNLAVSLYIAQTTFMVGINAVRDMVKYLKILQYFRHNYKTGIGSLLLIFL